MVDQSKSFALVQEATDNLFERIDDCILLQIFNRVGDFKALGRCCAVSKRFHSLVFLVENVTMKVDRVISGDDDLTLSMNWRGPLWQLLVLSFSLMSKFVRPFESLLHLLLPGKTMIAEVSHRSPAVVLRNFRAIQNLRIELPGGEVEIEDGDLLKWRAEFESRLLSCVILCGFRNEEGGPILEESAETDSNSLPEAFYASQGWNLRVKCVISSLIAASARHALLQKIILEHPTLVSLVLTDADKQGELSMSKKQLEEFKNKPPVSFASSNRTLLPPLNLKLWYAPYLEFPGRIGLKGATLAAIRPSDQPALNEQDSLASTAFEEPFNMVASSLLRSRTYFPQKKSL